MALARLTLVSLVDSCTMCISPILTPVLCILFTVIIEVYLQCFTESVSLRELGESTSRAEIISPNSLYFTTVNNKGLP